MVKKLILVALLVLGTSIVHAETISLTNTLQRIPAVKQGIAWSIEDSKLNHLSTVDIVKIKGFNVELGAAYDAENTGVKAVALLSYDLLKVKDVINLPILDLIEFRPGVYVGFGRIEGVEGGQIKGEGDYGLSLSVINVKF